MLEIDSEEEADPEWMKTKTVVVSDLDFFALERLKILYVIDLKNYIL